MKMLFGCFEIGKRSTNIYKALHCNACNALKESNFNSLTIHCLNRKSFPSRLQSHTLCMLWKSNCDLFFVMYACVHQGGSIFLLLNLLTVYYTHRRAKMLCCVCHIVDLFQSKCRNIVLYGSFLNGSTDKLFGSIQVGHSFFIIVYVASFLILSRSEISKNH